VLLVARPLAEIAVAVTAPAAAVTRPAAAALSLLDLLRLCAGIAAPVPAVATLGLLLFGNLLRPTVAALESRAVEVARPALGLLLLLGLPLLRLLLKLLLAHFELRSTVGLLLARFEAAAAGAFGADLLASLLALFARLLAFFAGLAVLGTIAAVVAIAAVLREGRRSGGAGKKDGD
jgi:hypothetical protein